MATIIICEDSWKTNKPKWCWGLKWGIVWGWGGHILLLYCDSFSMNRFDGDLQPAELDGAPHSEHGLYQGWADSHAWSPHSSHHKVVQYLMLTNECYSDMFPAL